MPRPDRDDRSRRAEAPGPGEGPRAGPGWTCPLCGRAHPVEPKWCGCEPYDVGPARTTYVVARLAPGRPPLPDPSDVGAPSLADLLGDRARSPFEEATIVAERTGDAAAAPGLAADLDALIEARGPRRSLDGSATGIVLIRERAEPHVEMLDSISWSVVDLTPEEARRCDA